LSSLPRLKEVCFGIAHCDIGIGDGELNQVKGTAAALLKAQEAYKGKEIPMVTFRKWEEVSIEAQM
jgi:hypothetical protein